MSGPEVSLLEGGTGKGPGTTLLALVLHVEFYSNDPGRQLGLKRTVPVIFLKTVYSHLTSARGFMTPSSLCSIPAGSRWQLPWSTHDSRFEPPPRLFLTGLASRPWPNPLRTPPLSSGVDR